MFDNSWGAKVAKPYGGAPYTPLLGQYQLIVLQLDMQLHNTSLDPHASTCLSIALTHDHCLAKDTCLSWATILQRQFCYAGCIGI